MSKTVFADTSFFVALLRERDQHHAQAKAQYDQVNMEQLRIITSEFVIFETGSCLSKHPFRLPFIKLMEEFTEMDNGEIVEATQDILKEALGLFATRPDKEWSLVDCFSFLIMQELQLTDALSADHHFIQAGFRTLL